MTRPRVSQRRLIRAFGALAVMFGIVFAPIEHLLPDAHDGDATTTERSALASGVAVMTGVESPAAASAPASDPTGTPRHAPDGGAQVDHCAHAHLLALQSSARAFTECVPEPEPFDLSSLRLSSVSLAPHQRPPIA